jgi:hypothetical protein
MSMRAAMSTTEAGPVFTRGATSDLLVALLRQQNPSARLINRGAYTRVLVPGGCRLLRADIEGRLGRPFVLPADLEELMPSWKGRLSISEDEVVWSGSEEHLS